MESFLASRPKLPGAEGLDSMDPTEGLAFGDSMGGGSDSFLSGIPRTGGFQSLKAALLEAGSVVDPAEAERTHRAREARSGTAHAAHVALEHSGAHDVHHGEPTVELITNNGRIEKVIVTCSCSKKIELDCTY